MLNIITLTSEVMLLVTELLTVGSVVDVTEHTEHNLAMAATKV